MTPTKAHTTRTAALNAFASAVKLEDDGQFAKALPILSQPLLREHPLREYVQYYKGLAELSRRPHDRRAQHLPGAHRQRARPAICGKRRRSAKPRPTKRWAITTPRWRFTSGCRKTKTAAPDDVLIRMGMAAEAAGDPEKAQSAFARAYYEFPFSDLSPAADLALDRLPNRPPIAPGTNRFKLELGRARTAVRRQALHAWRGPPSPSCSARRRATISSSSTSASPNRTIF